MGALSGMVINSSVARRPRARSGSFTQVNSGFRYGSFGS